MKIALLGDAFLLDPSTGINGTQVQIYNLSRGLSSRGLEVHCISLTLDKHLKAGRVNGINLKWLLSRNRPFGWVFEISRTQKILDEIDPDVIYQRGRSHLTFAAARWAHRRSRRFVWASNGEDSGEFWKQLKRLGRSRRPIWRKLVLAPYMAVQDLYIHRGLKGVDQVISQTEHQKQRILSNFGHSAVILPSVFLPSPGRRRVPKEKIVLWLANLSPGKQPELFIDLTKQSADLNDWRFILAGGSQDEDYVASLKARTKELPSLALVGPVPFDKSQELYARASVFVNTSLLEADGLPNSFIQAWLDGTPVFSLNHDPNGWITSQGLGYCAHGDFEDLSRALRRMLADRSQLRVMGSACVRFAEVTFGNEVIDRYVSVLEGNVRHTKTGRDL